MAYDLVARLVLKAEKFTGPLKQATAAVKSMDETVKKAAGGANKMGDGMKNVHTHTEKSASSMLKFGNHAGHASNGILSMYGYMLKMSAVMALMTATAAPFVGTFMAIKNGLKLSSDAEQASVAFETMLGSADKAQKFLKQLSDFANETPFELPQLRDSSKKMLAFGFSAEQVLPTLTAVGNAAAGLGLGGEGVDRITLALGQMRAKSKVSGDEMLQLTEAGIPAWEILAKKMNTTTATVMKLSEKGVIPADKAIQALIDGMNKKFPNMMEKQSHTLAGLWSTMKDTFNNDILVKFGDGIASGLKPRFEALVTWIKNNGATIERWGATLQRVAARASDWVADKFAKIVGWFRNLNSDEHFRSLTWDQKLSTAMDKAFDAVSKWAASHSGVIDKIAADMADVGLKFGKALGSSLVDGIKKMIDSDPQAAALMGAVVGGAAGAAFGPAGAAAGAVVGGVSGVGQHYMDKATNWYNDTSVAKGVQSVNNAAVPFTKFLNKVVTGGVTPQKKAGGLDRVPYNGFPAILHKDERVQTKAEADAYRSGRGGSGANITINATIRSDDDIDRLIDGIVRRLEAVH